MGGAGGHVKGRRYKYHPDTCPPHLQEQIRETDIKTDTDPHSAEFRIKDCHCLSRRQYVRFFEILAARYIDIKKMHFTVLSDQLTFPVKYVGSIVDFPLFISFGNRTANYIKMIRPGQLCQKAVYAVSILLREQRELAVVIGTGEDLRQKKEIRFFSLILSQHVSYSVHIFPRGRICFLLQRQDMNFLIHTRFLLSAFCIHKYKISFSFFLCKFGPGICRTEHERKTGGNIELQGKKCYGIRCRNFRFKKYISKNIFQKI